MELSVYQLLTQLCQNLLYVKSSPNRTPTKVHIKRLRSKCYEILIKSGQVREIRKQIGYVDADREHKQVFVAIFQQLENLADPECNLLAWRMYLMKAKGLAIRGEKIGSCIRNLKRLNMFETDSCSGVLHFLINLQSEPHVETSSSICDADTNLYKFESSGTDKFRLAPNLRQTDSNRKELNINLADDNNSNETKSLESRSSSDRLKGIESKTRLNSSIMSDLNIWNQVLNTPSNDHKIWETLDCTLEEREVPFLMESGPRVVRWVQVTSSLAFDIVKSTYTTIKTHVSHRQFIKDVKNLLVGIQSRTFAYDVKGELNLVPGIRVEGLSVGAINNYCRDLLLCGSSYKGLHALSSSTLELHSREYHHDGLIFAEFCKGISRYLTFYRIAVMSVPDSTNLLALHHSLVGKLGVQIQAMASVCKVGPFDESGQVSPSIPHGVSLLNHLYHEISSYTDQDTLMVLYALLFPCYQVYFKFLQQWILGGFAVDPHEEFFINTDSKYLASRGRTYWTRSYCLRENMVPDFLTEMQDRILYCGKATNLLKLCVPSSSLCSHPMGSTPCIFSCCLTREQLTTIERNNTSFYLNMCSLLGPRISTSELLERSKDGRELASLAAKKRAATLHRIRLERKTKQIEASERKKREMQALQHQYIRATYEKQVQVVWELEENLRSLEKDMEIGDLHDRLLDEEEASLIDHYMALHRTAEIRRRNIVKSTAKLKGASLDVIDAGIPVDVKDSDSSSFTNSSVYYEANENVEDGNEIFTDTATTESKVTRIEQAETLELDLINANTAYTVNEKDLNSNLPARPLETFQEAQKIKARMMLSEVDVIQQIRLPADTVTRAIEKDIPLTDAQKNRLKVLTSEFGLFDDTTRDECKTVPKRPSSAAERNRDKVMGISSCFISQVEKKIERESANEEETHKQTSSSDSTNLRSESITAATEFDHASLNSSYATIALPQAAAAAAADTDECSEETCKGESALTKMPPLTRATFSKRTTPAIASRVSNSCFDLYLKQSVYIPLITQTKLVDSELLHYFINDLQYLRHLDSLRSYFFLLDGEFGRVITDNLFEKLYDVDFPTDLINCRTLQLLIYNALDYSTKCRRHSEHHVVDFKINNIPKTFDLGDPDVFDCISLTYKVGWPLNILLPSDTISKYDLVFKFLLKLQRVSWVARNMFHDLKALTKRTESKKLRLLMASVQYRKLNRCRHRMTHFVETLKSYIIGEVLQCSWNTFESNLRSVTNIDQLYVLHTDYIKNILFMCLLNQSSLPLRKVIHKIVAVILKFFDHLRSRLWEQEEDENDGFFVHPNFQRLESIFENFEHLLLHFFKIGHKVVRSGYQPHLLRLLDMLDLTEYYAKGTGGGT